MAVVSINKHGRLGVSDPRTVNGFWLRTPEPMAIVVVLYLLFVFIAPRIMERRAPFDLKPLILIYNFALVFISGYMSLEVGSNPKDLLIIDM